jgi:hypothetical protein
VKVLRNGAVVRWHEPRWPGVARAGRGVWVRHTGGRLTLVRHGRVYWRSRINRGSDAVSVRGRTIVYANYPSRYEDSEEVWFARVGGGERRIARHEDPLGWTRAGLFLLQRGRDIVVRDSHARYMRTLHLRQTLFRPDRETLLALRYDGSLIRTDGRTTWTIARLRDRRWTLSDVVHGGLIVLVRPGAVLLLDRHGNRYASASFSQHRDLGGTIAVLPDGSIAFSLVHVRRHDAVDSVVLVRPAALRGVTLYTRRLPLSCGHWTGLAYRAGRLLYSSQGRSALIDPSRRHAVVDLTPVARAANGGRDDGASADWAR